MLVTWEARCGSRSTTLLSQDHMHHALSSRDVIGPYFLEDVSGDTQTVNAQRYRAVLAKFWRALKTKQKNDMEALQYSWFQQDGVQPTQPKKPRIGYRSASGSAWCQCLRHAPDQPAPRTWPHRNSFCGVTSSLTYTELLYWRWTQNSHLLVECLDFVYTIQYNTIPDQLEEPLRSKGGGEISGGLCTPSVCRPKAEAALRRAKLPRAKRGSPRTCPRRAPAKCLWALALLSKKYNWTGSHMVPDSRLYHQYNRKDASFKFVGLFWDTRYYIYLIANVYCMIQKPSVIWLKSGKYQNCFICWLIWPIIMSSPVSLESEEEIRKWSCT